jgi:hypothetical protein
MADGELTASFEVRRTHVLGIYQKELENCYS